MKTDTDKITLAILKLEVKILEQRKIIMLASIELDRLNIELNQLEEEE